MCFGNNFINYDDWKKQNIKQEKVIKKKSKTEIFDNSLQTLIKLQKKKGEKK